MLFSRHHVAGGALGLISLLLVFMTVESSQLRGELRYKAPDYRRHRLLTGMGKSKSDGGSKQSTEKSAHKTDDKATAAHEESGDRSPSKSEDNIYDRGSNDESKDDSKEKTEGKSKGESKGKGSESSKSKGPSKGESMGKGGEPSKSKGESKGKGSESSKSKGASKEESKGKGSEPSKSKGESKGKGSESSKSKGASKGESEGKGSAPSESKSKSDSKPKPTRKPTSKPSESTSKSDSKPKPTSSKPSESNSKSDSKPKPAPKPMSKPSESKSKSDSEPKPSSESSESKSKSDSRPQKPTSNVSDDMEQDDEQADKVPTNSPAPTNTPMPTKVPTNSPAPTNTPMPTNTPAPTSISECNVESNGTFGITTEGQQELAFFYQIETTPSVTEDIVNDALLPLVESAVANRSLPLLFATCEETGGRRLQEQDPTADPSKGPTAAPSKEQEPTADPSKGPTASPSKEQEPSADPSKGPTATPSREEEPTADPSKGPAAAPSKEQEPTAAPTKTQEPTAALSGVQGYSSLPSDRVLPGVLCFGSRENAANKCFVIQGGLRIYTAEEFDFQAISDQVIDEIKSAMESGEFNKLDGRIVNMTHLENVTIDEEPENSSSADIESETLPAWAWGIIGAGGFMVLVLCGFLFVQRRRKDEGSDEMTPLGDHGVDYAPPPASDHDNPYYDQVPLPQDSSEPLPQDSTEPQYSSTSDFNEPGYCPPPALDETSGDEDDETQEHRD